MLTIVDVCRALRFSRATVKKLIREGQIKAVTIGGYYRVPKEELDRILKGSVQA